MKRVLIIGASAAGLSTADALRRLGFDGEIVVAGDEPAYDRPPLSKQILRGEWDAARAIVLPPSRIAALRADLCFDQHALGVDLANRTVAFAGGRKIEYDDLVIATGARPRMLPGEACAAVHVVRTLEDSRRLREALLEHRDVLIVGAGFIGLEVASTAAAMGARVRVLEPVPDPLVSRIGLHAATRLLAKHRDAGVELRTGVAVRAVRPRAVGAEVILDGGESLESPVVVVGIGCVPNVEWLQGSGLTLENGVVCDAYCAAAPHVWAAGDVARWFHPGVGRHLRIEHRTNAQEQATAVARNILGAQIPFTPTPFFWSDQYDVKLQYAGFLPSGGDAGSTIEAGEPEGASFVRGYYSDGKLCAVVGWNAAKFIPAFRAKMLFPAPDVATSRVAQQ